MNAKVSPIRSAIHILVLALFTLLICAPVLFHGLPDWGNDVNEHSRWAKLFSSQLWEGELYPRWFSQANAGYGSPSFFIYPPMPYYVAAVFYPLVKSSDPNGVYCIGFSAMLALFASGLGVYLWCRSFVDEAAALFAALIYMILPYHLAADLYTRAAMGELWGLAWMPFVLLATFGVIAEKRWALLALICSYGLLVFSHLPTTLCFSLFPLAAAAILSEPGKKLRIFMRVAGGLTVGMCLGAAYVLPAQFEGPYMKVGGTHSGEFNYQRWWLTQIQPLFDSRTRLLLMEMLTIALVAGAAWHCYRYLPVGARKERRLLWLLLGTCLGALFMTTQLSKPVWMLFPLLQGLPFPTRFLLPFNIAAAGVIALGFPYFRAFVSRLVSTGMILVLLIIITATVWAGSKAYSVWRPFAPQQAAYYDKVHRYIRDYQAFWPKWTRIEVSDFPAFEQYVVQHPPRGSQLLSDDGQPIGAVTVESWKPRKFVLRIQTPTPAHLTVNHFYYPGWRGHVESSGKELTVAPSEPDGFLKLNVPEGSYQLTVTLDPVWPERAGNLLSLAALIVTAGLAIWTARTGRHLEISVAADSSHRC
jgi:hypothetical protein